VYIVGGVYSWDMIALPGREAAHVRVDGRQIMDCGIRQMFEAGSDF
jgi:hypothetical protein